MQVDLTPDEVAVLLGALKMVPVQDVEALKHVFALGAKLAAADEPRGAKDAKQEAPLKQGTQEAIQAGQARPEEGVAMAKHSKHKKGKKK